jgi:hypothetical protein
VALGGAVANSLIILIIKILRLTARVNTIITFNWRNPAKPCPISSGLSYNDRLPSEAGIAAE